MVEKIRQKRIGERLIHSSAITILMSAVANILCIIAMIIMLVMYAKVLDNYAFPQGDIGHAMAALAEMRSSTRGIVGYEDKEDIDYLTGTYNENAEGLNHYIELIGETIVSEDGRKDYNSICSYVEAYMDMNAKVITEASQKDKPELVASAKEYLINDVEVVYNQAYDALQGLMDTNMTLGHAERNANRIGSISTMIVAVMIVVTVMVVSYKLNKAIAGSISEPLHELSVRLNAFKDGDIKSEFPEYGYDDEIGDMIAIAKGMTGKLTAIFGDLEYLLQQMAEGNFDLHTSCEEEYAGDFKQLLLAIRQMNRNMNDALINVKGASEMVSAGAGNLAEASQALAEGATEQAASVEEMLATIDEIAAGISVTADEVSKSSSQAKQCMNEAQNSKAEMEKLVDAMTKVQETSKQISKIIDDIEDIASQTNLLSLNASIEAARAGEAGRGFAVVADQIGKLASDSAKSAVSTRQLIEGNITEVDAGNKAVGRTSEVLERMLGLVADISETSEIIAEKSMMQAESMEQAKDGVVRISEIVQSNSATAEQTSATSEELSAQAISMDELVAMFRLRS